MTKPDLSYLSHTATERFNLTHNQATMKAVVTTGNGGFDKLDYRDVPRPSPRRGEVLIKVLAAGINNTEINTRLGWYSSTVTSGTNQYSDNNQDTPIADGGWNEKTPFPLIQGTDCCGRVIDANPSDIADDLLNKRVLIRACMRTQGFDSLENIWMASDFDGAFAEYICAPLSEVFAVDCNWSDAGLATIPCAYATAENMVARANVGCGDRVLVTGASGGVGSAVVQLCQRRCADVLAVVSASKHAIAKQAGFETIISSDSDLVQTLGESSIDVIIDNVAGDKFIQLIKLLVRGGRYASSGAIAGPIVKMDMRDFYLKDIQLIGCTAWDEAVFPNLIHYIENGEISPLVARTFPLQDIATAQQIFLKKEHFGNFVLLPPASSR